MVHINLARAYDAVGDGSKAVGHANKAGSIAARDDDAKDSKEAGLILSALLEKYGHPHGTQDPDPET